MKLPSLWEIEAASEIVYQSMQASSQLSWPILNERAGYEIWVKHENHNPTGAFIVRGGIIYVGGLKERLPDCPGVCCATRGNHGQSLAFATAQHGMSATIVVPQGNSSAKNKAMEALGAELIVHGQDFDEAQGYCQDIAVERGLHFVPSVDAELIPGVATYALEFFRAAPPLDRIYVPIGLGSGICGVIAVKIGLGISTEIYGVISSHANAYQLSIAAGEVISTASANTIADGLAVRNPSPEALAVMQNGVSDIVAVDDDEVLRAINHYITDTHNVAEGAGAAALAAALKDQRNSGKRIGVVLTGGNIDVKVLRRALELKDLSLGA